MANYQSPMVDIPPTPILPLPVPQARTNTVVITGRITRPGNYKSKNRIMSVNLSSELSGYPEIRTVRIKAENFGGGRTGDLIEAEGRIYEPGPEPLILVTSDNPPLLYVNNSLNSIKEFIIKSLRVKRSGSNIANTFIGCLSAYAPPDPAGRKTTGALFMFLSQVSTYYQDHNSLHPDYANLEDSLLCKGITYDMIKRVLLGWIRDKIVRQLYLFGFYSRQIRQVTQDEIDPHPVVNMLRIASHNPHRFLSLDVEVCDKIAGRLHLDVSPRILDARAIAAWIYKQMESNSSTCIPSDRLNREFPEWTKVKDLLINEFDVKIVQSEKSVNDHIYLPYPFKVENRLIAFFNERFNKLREANDCPHYEPVYEQNQPSPDSDQAAAIDMALNSPLSLITGGPGRGKSTIIRQIVHNLKLRDCSYVVCSHTGKAVARLKEILGGGNPMTLHRLLARGIQQDESDDELVAPYAFEWFIYDEASMLTPSLFYMLISKYSHYFNIILVGDIHQLPPISWGALFQDLYDLSITPKMELKLGHRVSKNPDSQAIITNSDRIIERIKQHRYQRPVMEWDLTSCFQIRQGNIGTVKGLVNALINRGVTAEQFRVICPYNAPLDTINAHCQRQFHKPDEEDLVLDARGRPFHTNDWVLMTSNNYNINVMNGETGKVIEVSDSLARISFIPPYDPKGGHLFNLDYGEKQNEEADEFEFKTGPSDGRKSGNKADELEIKSCKLAHAFTVHASQGSEYRFVIIYIPDRLNSGSFINYKLLYTAITRAIDAVYIIEEERGAITRGVDKEPFPRYQNFTNSIIAEQCKQTAQKMVPMQFKVADTISDDWGPMPDDDPNS